MTHMEARCEVLLRRLSLVAALKPHEKLSVRGDALFEKHVPTPYMPVMRWYQGDGRHATVLALERTVEELLGIIRTESSRIDDDSQALRSHVDRWCSIARSSIGGLCSLRVTYADDDTIVDSLKLLIGRIEQHCPVHCTSSTIPSAGDVCATTTLESA